MFNYRRRTSSVVEIGDTPLGGNNPIRIQSMANVSTMDTDAAVEQAIRLIKEGCEYIRFTARNKSEAQNLYNIHQRLRAQQYDIPLVADIHFNPNTADVAALYVEKVRINPGNYVDKARFLPFLKLCQENNTAIRIGVNHGSLSGRIMNRYGDTPEGMVESCMEFLRLCAEAKFNNVVLSVKSSNTVMMIHTVRLLVRTMNAEKMNYPLHLGVTEAGDAEDGRIKSAIGIGTLLAEGLGDTIRVSLSEEPEAEIPVARKLTDYIKTFENHPVIEAVPAPKYNHTDASRRINRPVNEIGNNFLPVVISDRTSGDTEVDHRFMPDWIYTTPDNIHRFPDGKKFLIDAEKWDSEQHNDTNVFPYFKFSQIKEWEESSASTKFISLTYSELSATTIKLLKKEKNTVVILDSTHAYCMGEMRAFMHRLLEEECDVPVIVRRKYNESGREALQIKAAVDFGTLLTDGFGDGIMLCNDKPAQNKKTLDSYMFAILQAARVRISKTEYISCPGCGRTLFDLKKTLSEVKSATENMKGLKIGIMGCIVNGPGEMADADYGYVGAGKGRINLYKGKDCVLKNIPEKEAVKHLIKLINHK